MGKENCEKRPASVAIDGASDEFSWRRLNMKRTMRIGGFLSPSLAQLHEMDEHKQRTIVSTKLEAISLP